MSAGDAFEKRLRLAIVFGNTAAYRAGATSILRRYHMYVSAKSQRLPIKLGEEDSALQGYLWVTGTPFSLEYPSLRGGFGWHDISWKHHFQV